MSKKYDIKYLEPDLSVYNKYPQLIKVWENNLDINQLQNNKIRDYERKLREDERQRFINISRKREQRISPAEFQDYLKNIKLEDIDTALNTRNPQNIQKFIEFLKGLNTLELRRNMDLENNRISKNIDPKIVKKVWIVVDYVRTKEIIQTHFEEAQVKKNLKKKISKFKSDKKFKELKNKNKVLCKELNKYLDSSNSVNYETVKKWSSRNVRPQILQQQYALDSVLKINHWQSRFRDGKEIFSYVMEIWEEWISSLNELEDKLKKNDINEQKFFSENSIKNFLLNSIRDFPNLEEVIDQMLEFELNLYSIYPFFNSRYSDARLKSRFPHNVYVLLKQISNALESINKEFLLDDKHNLYSSLVKNALKLRPKYINNPKKFFLIDDFIRKVPNSNVLFEKEAHISKDNKYYQFNGENNYVFAHELVVEAKLIQKLFDIFQELASTAKDLNVFSTAYIEQFSDKLDEVGDYEGKSIFEYYCSLIIIWMKKINEICKNIKEY